MQNFKLTQFTNEIIKIKDMAIAISSQYNALISSCNDLTSQTKQSFEESKRNLTVFAQNYNESLGQKSSSMLTQIDELIVAVEASEKNLYEFDKSYANRKTTFSALNTDEVANEIFNEYDDYLEKVKKIVIAMQKLVNECSLSKKAYPIQELGMLFSKKRKTMYEKLYSYVCIAHKLRDEAFSIVPEVTKEMWEKSKIERDEKIDEAAMETAKV